MFPAAAWELGNRPDNDVGPMGEGSRLARHHTLRIRTAIAGTALLWAATFALSVTEYGPDRLHHTLLIGSLAALLATIGYACMDARTRAIDERLNRIESQIRDVSGGLDNAVNQVADELHGAVEVQGKTLRDDRLAAVHTLATHLRKALPPNDQPPGSDGQVA